MTIDLYNGIIKLWSSNFEALMFSAQNPYSNPVTNSNLNIKDQIMQFHQRKRMMQDLQFSATSNDYKLEDL